MNHPAPPAAAHACPHGAASGPLAALAALSRRPLSSFGDTEGWSAARRVPRRAAPSRPAPWPAGASRAAPWPAALLFAALLTAAGAQAQGRAAPLPPGYGALEAYPVPAQYGGPLEMDQCYFYGKRVWDLVQGRAMNTATVRQIRAQLEATLGAQAVAEDKADLELYWSSAYASPEAMAGTRFYRCGARLKLPIQERHGQTGAQCYGQLRLPAQAANARQAGQSAAQARAAVKSASPVQSEESIAGAINAVYAQKDAAGVARLLKDQFLNCMIKLGASS